MIFQLLEIGSKITEISDLITNKWAEILGWISIPTIATALIVCLFKLITAKISQKIAKKNIQPLVNEIDNAKLLINETCERLKTEFESKLIEYENVVKNSIEAGFANYEKAKAEICEELINADEELRAMVGEIKPKVIELLEEYEPKVEETIIEEEKQEEIIEENEIVEEELTKIEENNGTDPLTR